MRRSGSYRSLVFASILIVLGVLAFGYEGTLHAARRGDLGLNGARIAAPVRRVSLPPVVGALALVGGLTVLFVSTQRSMRAPTLR